MIGPTQGDAFYQRAYQVLDGVEVFDEGQPVFTMVDAKSDLELSDAERVRLAYQGKYPGYDLGGIPKWGDWRFLKSSDCFHHHIQRSPGKPSLTWRPINEPPTFIEGGMFGNLAWQWITPRHEGYLRCRYGPALYEATLPPVLNDPMGSRVSLDGVAGIQSARDRAVNEVLPQLGYGFKLPLFIKEMKDIESVITGCLRMIKLCEEYPMLWQLVKSYLSGRGDTATAAAAHLWTQFGLLPLVGDLIKFSRTLYSIKRQIADLNRKAGKNLSIHAQETLRLPNYDVRKGLASLLIDGVDVGPWTQSPAGSDDLYIDGKIHWTDHVIPQSAKYHLTVFYSYELSASFGKVNDLKMLMDALGVNWSPSQVWQGLPLSFVADWFVNVSSVLNKYADSSNVSVDIHVQQVVESIKYEYKRQTLSTMPYETVNPTVINRLGSSYKFALDPLDNQAPDSLYEGKVYSRKVTMSLPRVSERSLLRLPAGMRWVSLGSLIRQRLR